MQYSERPLGSLCHIVVSKDFSQECSSTILQECFSYDEICDMLNYFKTEVFPYL